MAIKDSHFQGVANAKKAGEELPVELLAVVGGFLVLFLIGAFVFWKRGNHEDSAPET